MSNRVANTLDRGECACPLSLYFMRAMSSPRGLSATGQRGKGGTNDEGGNGAFWWLANGWKEQRTVEGGWQMCRIAEQIVEGALTTPL